MDNRVLVIFTMDVEPAAQADGRTSGPATDAEGARRVQEYSEVLREFGYTPTYLVHPELGETQADLFLELRRCGAGLGLHLHAVKFRAEPSPCELGGLSASRQHAVLRSALEMFRHYLAVPTQAQSIRGSPGSPGWPGTCLVPGPLRGPEKPPLRIPRAPDMEAILEKQKGTLMHYYAEYGWLRGFNMVPSWGARIEQAWWDYDGTRFREEVALARGVHANCIRLWIEFTAWMADPEAVTERFLDAVAGIAEHGMKTMPCLFNRWHDYTYDYGGTYLEDLHRDWRPKLDYVRALVTPLAADERILVWDLCNEPQCPRLDAASNAKEVEWLEKVAETVRGCGAQQPITIGVLQVEEQMDLLAPISDVLCCHPYGRTPEQLREMLVVCRRIEEKHTKPMLCNECIPGCLDDRRRAECARWSIAALEEAGYGWMGWGMREGRAISTRRDRYDGNGLDNQGFHAWFNADGSLREGLAFLLEPPHRTAPWEGAL